MTVSGPVFIELKSAEQVLLNNSCNESSWEYD